VHEPLQEGFDEVVVEIPLQVEVEDDIQVELAELEIGLHTP